MKKIFATLLALAMLLAFAGCGSQEQPQQTTEAETPTEVTEIPTETTGLPETTAPAAAEVSGYGITFNGCLLVPGAVYDASALPEPASVYQVPSCAIEGTDNVYNFETLEITAFNDGTGETIYLISLIDPNIATDEGLMLGDSAEKVIELYGEEYLQNGTAMVYTLGSTTLTIIIQNDYVVAIEYCTVG